MIKAESHLVSEFNEKPGLVLLLVTSWVVVGLK